MNKIENPAKRPDAEAMALRLLSTSLERLFFLVKPAGHEAEICLCFHKVLWVEADNNCSHLHLIDSLSIKVQMSISRVEELLTSLAPGEFIRVNRSEIINLRWLDRIDVYLVRLLGRPASFTVGKTYREKFDRRTATFRLGKM